MQQLRLFFAMVFPLHISGDNATHHQEYNAVYGLSGRQVYCKLTKSVITIIFYTKANMQSQVVDYFTIKHDARNHKY